MAIQRSFTPVRESCPAVFSALFITTLNFSPLWSLSTAYASSQPSDYYVAQSQPPKLLAKEQQRLAQQQTKLGMSSHFDPLLNRATFVWAPATSVLNFTAQGSLQQTAQAHMQRLSGIANSKSAQHQAGHQAQHQAQLSHWHDLGRGAVIGRYRQYVQGIEVFNRHYNVMLDRRGELVASSGYFAEVPSEAQNFSALSAFSDTSTAVYHALRQLSGASLQLESTGTQQGYNWFRVQSQNSDEFFAGVRTKAVFYPLDGELLAAHYVEVERQNRHTLVSDYFAYVIDSGSNKVLFKKNLQNHATAYNYRVYADGQNGYPMEGPHGDVIPAMGLGQEDETVILNANLVSLSYYPGLSTADPWLSDTATRTQGNNVYAYADINAPQGFSAGDLNAETTSAFTFDYVLDPDLSSSAEVNVKAAVVNLFYMNNFLHDFFYDLGFDESAGVAQLSNYGRGGVEGDPINAEAQDYSGMNNANMATPADGASPRMQMFVFDSKDARVGEDYGVIGPNGLLTSTQRSQFGPDVFDISGELVRYNDGNDMDSASVYDGCEVPLDPSLLVGKVAIIERGTCTFVTKVKNAQDAGALAALITNNVDDGTAAPMGGVDGSISIGNMGLNFADGQMLYNALDGGAVNVRLFNTNPLKDGTFDNGIIAHEWGHYMSNRLVGNGSGLVNFQGRALGEGWSDFHSLLFIAKEEDAAIAGNSDFTKPYATGTYVEDFYFGIRRVPFTPNQTINPLNFRHISEGAGGDVGLPPTSVASPHGPGELWVSVLWDSYVALINHHGFAQAQQRMARYLVGGYKMTPVAPLYTEARDALLATIAAEDMTDYRLVLAAFAKRGLGLGAQSPERYSTNLTGVVESYETELAAFAVEEVKLDADSDLYCSQDGFLDVGERGSISVQIFNTGSETLTNVPVQFTVLSAQGVNLGNGGNSTVAEIAPFASARSEPISIYLLNADVASELEIEVSFPEQSIGDDIVEPQSITAKFTVNFSFTDAPLVNASQGDDMEKAVLSRANLPLHLLKSDPRAENTLRFDNSEQIALFEQSGFELGEQALFLNNNGYESDVALTTRPFMAATQSELRVSFWHYYVLEELWDGAVLEIRVDDGDWQDVTEVGGQFSVGYDAKLNESPTQSLQLRNAYTGRNSSAGVLGNKEEVSFGSLLAGRQVQFRFRLSTDVNVKDIGWWIDNLSIEGMASGAFYQLSAPDEGRCDNRAPTLAELTAQTVDEGEEVTLTAQAEDVDGDTLSYQWRQTQGPSVTLSGAQTATMSFTAPQVSSQQQLHFTLSVNDGALSAEQSVVVTVNNVVAPPPAPEPSSGGGGGSVGWLTLILLAAIRVLRKN
ncbi:rhombosortase-dependent M36 family metallopeptidase [Pseudoalteromonas sp. T1lg75]|uniref:rhombosortase-dependent M36 family metallopeptidase n=1 Tax=Pseudoalteromonas sp. T1lg75 TaxID=2077102 RepID=UPI000CF63DF4|nr:rhombosortase-dependent M36 family metallopeptidase [Pseudoalteromonas sp. T1lg75]